jgi:CrcB protein
MNFVLVFAGGGLGCMLRYLIGLGFQKTSLSLPWGTFISNLSACIIFAVTLWLLSSKETGGQAIRLLLLTGFCGGLSTFSSFGFETFLLLKQGLLSFAVLNILFNTACCLLIFYIFNS